MKVQFIGPMIGYKLELRQNMRSKGTKKNFDSINSFPIQKIDAMNTHK